LASLGVISKKSRSSIAHLIVQSYGHGSSRHHNSFQTSRFQPPLIAAPHDFVVQRGYPRLRISANSFAPGSHHGYDRAAARAPGVVTPHFCRRCCSRIAQSTALDYLPSVAAPIQRCEVAPNCAPVARPAALRTRPVQWIVCAGPESRMASTRCQPHSSLFVCKLRRRSPTTRLRRCTLRKNDPLHHVISPACSSPRPQPR